ncbi:hypothetical protein [Gordonia sp. SL306]|uniref:hypothetical protein n=1 Tax=Gordonia sp. SL306 TaxID=2995145 RepID=UPI00226FB7FC|nr:hypothetical protein [Gordonia sp. SL306]WAC56757.1 hypothetical protein OVA31_05745 [Gordonia sp. SL306]
MTVQFSRFRHGGFDIIFNGHSIAITVLRRPVPDKTLDATPGDDDTGGQEQAGK